MREEAAASQACASSRAGTEGKPARSRRLRVTFVGFERFWMEVLVDGLSQRHGDVLDTTWMVWPSTWGERARFVLAMMRSDVVVRVGMPFEFESETNRLWLRWLVRQRRVRGVNYWIGFDVHALRSRCDPPSWSRAERLALTTLSHWAAGPNLTEALVSMGVPATTVVFPSPSREVMETVAPLPERFRVLLYWADGRWEYSGGPHLVACARRLPDVEFDVVGASGSDLASPPPNMTFHGRVTDMDRMYERSTVLVRMVQWDSVPAGMVEEALLFARHVVYSFEFPHTVYVPFGDESGLVASLVAMRDAHSQRILPVNVEGRRSIIEAWVPDTRWATLCASLLRLSTRSVAT